MVFIQLCNYFYQIPPMYFSRKDET